MLTVADVVEAYALALRDLVAEPRALARSVGALIRWHKPSVWGEA
jgi:hypothetical protein